MSKFDGPRMPPWLEDGMGGILRDLSKERVKWVTKGEAKSFEVFQMAKGRRYISDFGRAIPGGHSLRALRIGVGPSNGHKLGARNGRVLLIRSPGRRVSA